MTITMLRSFGGYGFTCELHENNKVIVFDSKGRELKEGLDYIIEDQDIAWPFTIIQSNGIKTEQPPS